MPFNVSLTEQDVEVLEEGGGLKPNTIADRKRIFNNFDVYVEGQIGQSIETLMSCNENEREENENKLGDLFSTYFYSLRIKDKDGNPQWPKKGYADRIKSNIKTAVLESCGIDLTDAGKFPNHSKKWKAYIAKLVDEGRSETEHHPEVDPNTMESIYELLINVKEALESRGQDCFDEKLSKVPLKHHNRLHYILQWGAQLLLILFEARRGSENLEFLKKEDMAIIEDPIKKFKFIRHIKTEADKNHTFGTDSRNYGCIPFMQFTDRFNPGEYFEFYLSLLPDETGIYLFPKPRQINRRWNILDNTYCMYEAKMKGIVPLSSELNKISVCSWEKYCL